MGRASRTKAFRKAYRVAMAEHNVSTAKYEEPRRQFLGKLTNFANKTEQYFFERMLKAYLKGKEYFQFGIERESDGTPILDKLGRTMPAHYKVAQSFK